MAWCRRGQPGSDCRAGSPTLIGIAPSLLAPERAPTNNGPHSTGKTQFQAASMESHSPTREGTLAGIIGAASVALWFLIVDSIAGRPFFTPAILGASVFDL